MRRSCFDGFEFTHCWNILGLILGLLGSATGFFGSTPTSKATRRGVGDGLVEEHSSGDEDGCWPHVLEGGDGGG